MTTEKRVFRKSRNLAGGSGKFRAWNKFSVGDEVVVRYLDQKMDTYGKPAYRCECLDAKFVNEDGADYIGGNLTLNSTGMLDKAMKDIRPGQMIMVTYNGQVAIAKGKYVGKMSHTMDIDLVEEDDGEAVPVTEPVDSSVQDDGDFF